ncbi:MAG: DUF4065 domain-containing protein [Candidatus Heimdallarchaeota archaeon]|nr:DUF4065 domain-containing protein [Candidatus Heimdallarchaeota archaeon]
MEKSGLDLIILLLYKSKNHKIYGTTKLTKLLFLLLFEGNFKEIFPDFDFTAYNFGPWSDKIMDYTELLVDEGYLDIETKSLEKPEESFCISEFENEVNEEEEQTVNQIKIYNLTREGTLVGKKLYEELAQTQKEKLDKIIARYSNLSIDKLIDYVYENYETYTTESLIKDQTPLVSPEKGFREKYPEIEIDPEFFKVVGILSEISLEEEKEELRKLAIKRFIE